MTMDDSFFLHVLKRLQNRRIDASLLCHMISNALQRIDE